MTVKKGASVKRPFFDPNSHFMMKIKLFYRKNRFGEFTSPKLIDIIHATNKGGRKPKTHRPVSATPQRQTYCPIQKTFL